MPLHARLEEQLQLAGLSERRSEEQLTKLLELVSETYTRFDTVHANADSLAARMVPMLYTDARGTVVEWNTHLSKLTGFVAEDVVGKKLVSLMKSEARSLVVRMLGRAMQGYVRFALRAQYGSTLAIMPSGLQAVDVVQVDMMLGSRHVDLTLGASARYDVHGNAAGAVVIAQKPSSARSSDDDHMDSRKQLAEDQKGVHDVLDAAHVAFAVIDGQGRITYWNRRLEVLTGYQRHDVMGEQLWKLSTFAGASSQQPQVSKLLERAFRGEHVTGVEISLSTASGAHVILQMSATPMGRDNGVVLVGVNTNPDSALEEEAPLAAKSEHALDTKESKGRFLSAMSHELRTPLNGLLGSLELAMQRSSSTDLLVPLHHASTSARHLQDMINDLLVLSAIDAGTLELEQERFNLHEMLQGVAESYAARAAAKALKFEAIHGDSIPDFVVGDRHRIEQVLHNLCDNALHFTKVGGFSLKTEASPQEKDSVLLSFTVSDTGVGIKPDHLPILFSLFSSSLSSKHSLRSGIRPGAGLGLAICRELLSLMKGTIKCTSEYGHGSTFEACLILERTLPGSPLTRQPSVALSAALPQSILVVEDDELNSWVVGSMLEAEGYRVLRAFDGTEAIEVLKRGNQICCQDSERREGRKVDLILMDCSMPTMDGFMATAVIRWLEELEGPESPHVPIVALTAYALSSDRVRCLETGMDDYLTKPVGRSALLKAVRNHQAYQTSCRSVADLRQHTFAMKLYADRLCYVATTVLHAMENNRPSVAAMEASHLCALCMIPPLIQSREKASQLVKGCSAVAKEGAVMGSKLLADAKELLNSITTTMQSMLPPSVNDEQRKPTSAHTTPLPVPPPAPAVATEKPPAPEHASIQKPAVDLRAAVENIGGDRDMAMRLLTKFRDHAKPTLTVFQDALKANNIDVIRREAHSLKGSSGYVAANGLRSAAMALQHAADCILKGAQPDTPLPVLVTRVTDELKRVEAAIHSIVNSSSQESTAQDSSRTPKPALEGHCGPGTQESGSPAVPSHSPATSGSAGNVPKKEEDTELAVINWKEALEHFGGEESILLRLLSKFCDRAGLTLETLRAALSKGDMGALRREAHSLSGSCAYIAATRLQKAANALQIAADQALTSSSGAELAHVQLKNVEEEQQRLLHAIASKMQW